MSTTRNLQDKFRYANNLFTRSSQSKDVDTIQLDRDCTVFSQETRCTNQIHELCATIDHAVFSGVQKSLNTLRHDCKRFQESINERLHLHQ